MEPKDSQSPETMQELLRSVRRRLGLFSVAVLLLTLAVLLNAAAVCGYIVDFHAAEALLYGGVCAGAALLGFLFGFAAGRWL